MNTITRASTGNIHFTAKVVELLPVSVEVGGMDMVLVESCGSWNVKKAFI